MTVTTGQLMLAATMGLAGVIAAFAPAMAITASFLTKPKTDNDDTSIWKFMLTLMVVQLLVAIFFYWGVQVLNIMNKFAGMNLIGDGGAFDVFWTVKPIYTSAEAETWSTIIVLVRDAVKMFNAFLPFFIIFGGVYVGYSAANKDLSNRGATGNNDFLMLGFKTFVSAFIAGIIYYNWAAMASVTLMMPSTISGEHTMLTDAAQQWWREAIGVIKAKPTP
ncbi:MAG: hypothetical protein M1300_04175 [Epsilonproteobacteria bacterium]|nr:hypothetical protein [Campylobacterota bacterium]